MPKFMMRLVGAAYWQNAISLKESWQQT